ncbi:hypothetical protein CRG98_019464 [Punica granatum]|uniref:Retrovirus-related Pol polyprotein from transposon TNT 1-94-like beta-barrel domain-containing protein n=1 Tax=Punica granatum TaxID=22663 RepID=A0A2I0JW68_PUNGR|nr:hypothetical protein CRG98_019464 [Punica granatum]
MWDCLQTRFVERTRSRAVDIKILLSRVKLTDQGTDKYLRDLKHPILQRHCRHRLNPLEGVLFEGVAMLVVVVAVVVVAVEDAISGITTGHIRCLGVAVMVEEVDMAEEASTHFLWTELHHFSLWVRYQKSLAALNLNEPSSHDAYLDSGASSHMVNTEGILSHSTPYYGSDGVIVGDGSLLPVKSIGSMKIPALNTNLQLKDTLYVLGLGYNLVSIKRLCKDNNCHVIFTDSGFIVKDNNSGKMLLNSHTDGSLYPIPLPRPVALVATTHSPTTWHRRLGHPNKKNHHSLSRIEASTTLRSKLPSSQLVDNTSAQPTQNELAQSSHIHPVSAQPVSALSDSTQIDHVSPNGSNKFLSAQPIPAQSDSPQSQPVSSLGSPEPIPLRKYTCVNHKDLSIHSFRITYVVFINPSID